MSHKAEIERVLNDVYGIGIAHAFGPVGLWAAERCSDPKAALVALNRVLARHGKPLCHAPFGHVAF